MITLCEGGWILVGKKVEAVVFLFFGGGGLS